MSNTFDSSKDTLAHILRINELMHLVIKDICFRADKHDRSKLSPAEKEVFDEFTPKLKDSTYGSDEYKGFLEQMGTALKHHYTNNKNHHPDLHPNGIKDMNLLDMVEMLIDWKAASERHDNGNVLTSIDINKIRFNMSDDLVKIFENTVDYLNFAKPVRIVIDTVIQNDDFKFLENDFIKRLETEFGIRHYGCNCLYLKNNVWSYPEESIAAFKESVLYSGSAHNQYYFKVFKSKAATEKLIVEILDFLKQNDYQHYEVWFNK